MAVKGYVVRGTDIEGLTLYAMRTPDSPHGLVEVYPERELATEHPTIAEAVNTLERMCDEFDVSGVRIFAVTGDERLVPLPTYEEALAENERLRQLHTEIVARLRRERLRVREAEFFAAREGAEMLDGLVALFEAAHERILEGHAVEAFALLRLDGGEPS